MWPGEEGAKNLVEMLPKLNLVSALAALVFFFLPWVEIECSGEKTATQTGFQAITGTATPNKPAQAQGPKLDGGSESLGNSYLAAFALVGVISAAVIGFASMISDRADLARATAFLCGCAFVCLAIQLVIGFPVETTLREKLGGQQELAGKPKGPLDEIGREFARKLAAEVKVRPAKWFYLELGALGIPPLLMLGASVGSRRTRVDD